MSKYLKNQKGTTLLELMVAISLFVVVILLATSIFQSVMEGQQGAIAGQNTQESMRYFLEMMSREVRTALGENEGTVCHQEDPDASVGTYKTYNVTDYVGGNDEGRALHFRNKDNECVTYKLDNGCVFVSRKREDDASLIYEGCITPDEIIVSDLLFYIIDDETNTFHSVQPLITIRMDAEANLGKERHRNQMSIQTSVSSRYYDGS